ncbi:LPS translocon maturation chaperone LptM [Gayadomonas joobiniege]|nr:lipoprotein [Gayadomonas joobiniege]
MRFKTIYLSILLSALLAGCGQKGPLYLPEQPTQPSQQPTDKPT